MDYINEQPQMSSHDLKITGLAHIDEELSTGRDYTIAVNGEIDKIIDETNSEGIKKKIFCFKPNIIEIVKDTGETIKGTYGNSASKKLRGAVYFYQQENYPEAPEEEFYQRFMKRLIANLPMVAEMLKNIKE